MAFLALLVIAAGLAYRASTADDRARAAAAAKSAIERLANAFARSRHACAPYYTELRARSARPIGAPILLALNIGVFAGQLFGRGAIADPGTLIAWGASFGPRTTNGEWWRLLTSAFVHTGFVALVVNLVAIAQVAPLLERVVGRTTFALVCVSSTLFAGLVCLIVQPVTVSASASSTIAGLYGLLIACMIADVWRPTEHPIPLAVAKYLLPAAAFCIVFNVFDASVPASAELTATVVGLVAGLVLTITGTERRPSTRVLRIASAALTMIAIVGAFTLRGIADVRPEIANVLSIEDRTAPLYRTAADRLTKGQISKTALADVIERKIMPELREADERLQALHGVPDEHRQWVADAAEYVKLRYASWRLRAEGLRAPVTPPSRDVKTSGVAADASWRERAAAQYRASERTMGKAEAAERTALEARARIRPVA